MRNFSSWIDLDCKPYYLDSKKRGLRVITHDGIDEDIINGVRDYLCFIRKKYFFPIRCNVHLTNNEKYRSSKKGFCSGVFFPGTEAPKHYPCIYLPAKQLTDKQNLPQRLFDLTCLLTYYYQWFFECEKKYSHRSLEIEATKAATFLVNEYLCKCEERWGRKNAS